MLFALPCESILISFVYSYGIYRNSSRTVWFSVNLLRKHVTNGPLWKCAGRARTKRSTSMHRCAVNEWMSQRVRERDDENYPYCVLHYWRHFTMTWNGEKNIENTCQQNAFPTKKARWWKILWSNNFMSNAYRSYICDKNFTFNRKGEILINKFSINWIVDKWIDFMKSVASFDAI